MCTSLCIQCILQLYLYQYVYFHWYKNNDCHISNIKRIIYVKNAMSFSLLSTNHMINKIHNRCKTRCKFAEKSKCF